MKVSFAGMLTTTVEANVVKTTGAQEDKKQLNKLLGYNYSDILEIKKCKNNGIVPSKIIKFKDGTEINDYSRHSLLGDPIIVKTVKTNELETLDSTKRIQRTSEYNLSKMNINTEPVKILFEKVINHLSDLKDEWNKNHK